MSSDIPKTENLGRGVFSKSTAKRATRRIIANVFLEKRGKRTISVDRLDIAPSLDEIIAISDKVAEARKASAFYGWAVIAAEKAGANKRKVLPTPQRNNPYHADIILPDIATQEREEQKKHAQELADNSIWRECPRLK